MDTGVKVKKSWVTLQTDNMYKEADIFILAILQPKAREYIYIIIIIISECIYVDNNIRYGGTE